MKINNNIIIKDWTGKVLFKGLFKSKTVDKVLDANRCYCKTEYDGDVCWECDGTGYKGDFEVYWVDENDDRNVYEYINY